MISGRCCRGSSNRHLLTAVLPRDKDGCGNAHVGVITVTSTQDRRRSGIGLPSGYVALWVAEAHAMPPSPMSMCGRRGVRGADCTPATSGEERTKALKTAEISGPKDFHF